MTECQMSMLSILGAGWVAEHTIPTGKANHRQLPKHLKIDLAHPELKLAIELDGVTHIQLAVRRADKQKVRFLLCNGWSVLRMSNAKARSLCSTCKSADTLLTTLMEYFHTTATF